MSEKKDDLELVNRYLDIDYWDKLSESEREWLNEFIKNHYRAYYSEHLTNQENINNSRRSDSYRRDIYNYHKKVSDKTLLEKLPDPENTIHKLIELNRLNKKIKGNKQ